MLWSEDDLVLKNPDLHPGSFDGTVSRRGLTYSLLESSVAHRKAKFEQLGK